MLTLILVLLFIVLLTAPSAARRTPGPASAPSYGVRLNRQANNRADRSNPAANSVRSGWEGRAE